MLSKKPAAGTLEAAALSLAQEVSGNPDDWERRRKALYSMQQAVDDAGKALFAAGGGGEKAVFTAEVWRYLREPLKHTLVRFTRRGTRGKSAAGSATDF